MARAALGMLLGGSRLREGAVLVSSPIVQALPRHCLLVSSGRRCMEGGIPAL